jgi:hypothetical protein
MPKDSSIMTLNKSTATTNTANAQNGFLPENKLRVAFQPQFATSQPIESDENGTPIKGTALLIYQGDKHSTIDWIDEKGVAQSVAKLAFVFAVRSIDGSFKNIGQKTSYGWVQGNDLDKMINKLGGKASLEKISHADNELFGDDFGTITRIDFAATNESLEALRGKAYTAVLERKVSNKGAIYHEIDISSITPRLGKDGSHIQAQKPSETNPNAVLIDWED